MKNKIRGFIIYNIKVVIVLQPEMSCDDVLTLEDIRRIDFKESKMRTITFLVNTQMCC